MKGPFERLKYELRRTWECPDCHHRERSSGAITALWCNCQQTQDGGPQRAMRLAEDGVRRVLPGAAASGSDSRRAETTA